MKKLRSYILIASAFIIAVLGLMLPSVILHIQDIRLEKTVDVFEIDEVDLTLLSNLSTVQKLVLTSSSTQTISLDTGRFMNEEEAVNASNEVLTLFGMSSTDIDGITPECSVCLKSDNDGQSIVLWDITYTSDDFTLTISLDDETGLMLALEIHRSPADTDSSIYTDSYYGTAVSDVLYNCTEIYFLKYLGLDYIDPPVIDGNNTMLVFIYDDSGRYPIYMSFYPELTALYINVFSENTEDSGISGTETGAEAAAGSYNHADSGY